MRRVDDYRKNARDCRELANRMPPEHRRQLLQMAAEWDKLAEERLRVLTSSANDGG